jgi:glucose-1-phosphate cytidylyltransferase
MNLNSWVWDLDGLKLKFSVERILFMKVAILAGGLGTRLAEETEVKPKPMVEIGGMPILWHIMMHYAHYGFQDFAIALGYKGEVIKKYMVDYCSLNSNLTVNLEDGIVRTHGKRRPSWMVDLIDTGANTNTGGRIKRLAPYMGNETFMLTWGDGVSDLNLQDLLAFHRSHGKLATLTAVRPPARFGHLELDGNQIFEFSEKPQAREGWINGAFFVLEPEIFDYIAGDETQWEKDPLEHLAKDGQLMAYLHTSFWQCMDTLRDKRLLESLWQSGNAPWKIWQETQHESIVDGTQRVHRNSNGAYAASGAA